MSYFTKGSFIGNVDNYANTPVPETYSKKVMTQIGANANLFINSRDRNSGTYSNPSYQPYNDFVITKGFPISQGQINSIIVSEVNIPIPFNITPNNNIVTIFARDLAGNILNDVSGNSSLRPIIIPPGYYTGTQLATYITTIYTNPLNVVYIPYLTSVVYNTNGTFTWTFNMSNITGSWTQVGFIPLRPDVNPYPTLVSELQTLLSGRSINDWGLMDTMGMTVQNPSCNQWSIGVGTTVTIFSSVLNVVSGTASMLYTDFIDITSDVLTQYQELTDTSTDRTNPAHIIARIYINDEISKASIDASGNPVLTGTLYTKLHRQFKNPKIIRWNGQNSVDRIDLRLYDDQGRPLYVPPCGYDDFQLTIMPVEL